LQLPVNFIQSLQDAIGFNQSEFIEAHLHPLPITSIRLNTNKIQYRSNTFFVKDQPIVPNIVKQIKQLQDTDHNIITEVPWCNNGLYLSKRPLFTIDPLLHAGAYYVQEASSMFLQYVLKKCIDINLPLHVLDLCAAPGGKSTLLQSMLSKQSVLVSNEVIKTRVTILAENITKSGAENVIVTNNDPKDFNRLPNFFDVIVVDAPCSGSGLFRKDSKAIDEWSEQNVALCSQRQQRIIADILPSLKENGVLIYSTCSYSIQEDEEIIDWLVANHCMESILIQVDDTWGIIETVSPNSKGYGYRFYPDKVKGEGFFIAALRKTESTAQPLNKRVGMNAQEKTPIDKSVLKNFVQNIDAYFFIHQHQDVIAMPNHMQQTFFAIQANLYIKKAGIKIGQIIRTDVLPDHELAMSAILQPLVNTIQVDEYTALQYLRRQEIAINNSAKGWTLLCHNFTALGWVKILPNRVNNYYPKEWRIINK
jgi:NOL1/NOP2/sun family putative RNA methylase